MKIGQDVETDKIVDIDDIPRQSGLYILGKPGMGKSNLIELSVLSDIKEVDGAFFLDPHGDSIDKIIKYLKPTRWRTEPDPFEYYKFKSTKDPVYLPKFFLLMKKLLLELLTLKMRNIVLGLIRFHVMI